jgi:3-oxoacyl-[acyl-carrier-protein] synthase-3
MSFTILGTGHYLPERSVSNEELAEFLDTSDEWIYKRLGIHNRRVCTTESAAFLAFRAGQAALEHSGVTPEELDLIVCATISEDCASPSMACLVQNMLGARCPAFDVSAACSGFIYALDTAAGFFARKAVRRVLVIGAERMTRLLDWTDRGTAIIFGDGAGAAVLGPGDAYLASRLCAKGGDDVLKIPQFAGECPFYTREKETPFLRMNGQETFKFAVHSMQKDLLDVISQAGLQEEDIDWVIPHQANIRIIDAARKRLRIPPERYCTNIENTGNTSAASVPILLDELWRSGKLKNGDYIAMTSFGAGLTSAACLLRAVL